MSMCARPLPRTPPAAPQFDAITLISLSDLGGARRRDDESDGRRAADVGAGATTPLNPPKLAGKEAPVLSSCRAELGAEGTYSQLLCLSGLLPQTLIRSAWMRCSSD
eukprot:6184010-Pleurochrysis_carterae.AAC.2